MPEPTIEDLRLRLEAFEEALSLCDFYDDWGLVQKCRRFNEDHIARLKERIAEFEHPARSGEARLGEMIESEEL